MPCFSCIDLILILFGKEHGEEDISINPLLVTKICLTTAIGQIPSSQWSSQGHIISGQACPLLADMEKMAKWRKLCGFDQISKTYHIGIIARKSGNSWDA